MVYQCDRLIFLVDLVYHRPIYFFRLFFVGDIDHDFFFLCAFFKEYLLPCWSSCVPVPRVIAVGIDVDIGIPAVRLNFLQEVTAVPNKSGFLFEAV